MTVQRHLRLDGLFTLRAPLSHIGESAGTDSFLAQDLILGEDGVPVECFTYSGNGFRGAVRDLAAADLLDRLKCGPLGLSSFHLLFSGGALSGGQCLDLAQARALRECLPMVSLLGAAVGGQLLPGKVKIGALYPLVAECMRVLPSSLRRPGLPSWHHLTFDRSFTRFEDARNPLLRDYRREEAQEAGETQQMRYTVELLAGGTEMYQRVDFLRVSEVEIGVFVAALERFAGAPYLGGKSGSGYGLTDVCYRTVDGEEFVSIVDGHVGLAPAAAAARDAYFEQIDGLRAMRESGDLPAAVAEVLGGGGDAAAAD